MPFLDTPLSHCYYEKFFREDCLLLIHRVARRGGVTLQLLQFKKNTFGLDSAMGKWNSYAVIVTQGVSNPNDRLGFKVKTFLFVGRHKPCTGRV